MNKITYTYHWTWYKSRYSPDKPFKVHTYTRPDSTWEKIKDEAETISLSIEEAKAEVEKWLNHKNDLSYKDMWDSNDYATNNWYNKVIRELEHLIREVE